MGMWQFIFSKHFIRQLLWAAAIGVAIIWGSLKLLDLYTLHGRTITVPDLEGHSEAEAAERLYDLNLRHLVIDSIFDASREAGSVALQAPPPGTKVKRNRTIYLTTVAALPEMIPMPDLTDLSRRQAISILETHGLAVGQLTYQPDIARDAVLRQKVDELFIEPGTPVEKGTAIDLVLGEGLGDHMTMVPLVIGMSQEEAVRSLNRAALNLGEVVSLDGSEENLKVYMQDPDPLDEPKYMQLGSEVNLFMRSTDLFDFEAYLEELLSVPMPRLTGLNPAEVEALLDELELKLGMEVFEQDATQENARVYRQEPEYQEGMILQKGEAIDVWYRAVEEEQEGIYQESE